MKAFTIPVGFDAIPSGLRDALERYVRDGVIPGDFLRAVLQNDLRLAVRRGDPIGMTGVIPQLVRLLAECAPSDCWGSPELVTRWVLLKEREAQKAKVVK